MKISEQEIKSFKTKAESLCLYKKQKHFCSKLYYPIWHLLVQRQQWKQQNNVKNLLKANNKETRTKSKRQSCYGYNKNRGLSMRVIEILRKINETKIFRAQRRLQRVA